MFYASTYVCMCKCYVGKCVLNNKGIIERNTYVEKCAAVLKIMINIIAIVILF